MMDGRYSEWKYFSSLGGNIHMDVARIWPLLRAGALSGHLLSYKHHTTKSHCFEGFLIVVSPMAMV